MRTTLTLDDDVAAALARRRAERGTGLRREVNELLRAGLSATSPAMADPGETYELPTFAPDRAVAPDHKAMQDLLDEQGAGRAISMSLRAPGDAAIGTARHRCAPPGHRDRARRGALESRS